MKNRNEIIDIMKGIGIFYVVCLHRWLPIETAAVTMPLFFMISGFFAPSTNKIPFIEGVQKKNVQLLFPYLKYMVFFAVLNCLLGKIGLLPKVSVFSQLNFEKLFYWAFFDQPNQQFAWALWFVGTLYLAFVLWFVFRSHIESLIQTRWGQVKLFVITTFVYFITIKGPTIPENLFWGGINRTIYAFIFLCWGYVLYSKKEIFNNVSLKALVIILAVCGIYWRYRYWSDYPLPDVRTMFWKNHLQTKSLFITICGIALIYVEAYAFSKIALLKSIFIYLGQQSFHIMGLHWFGFFILEQLLDHQFINEGLGFNLMYIIGSILFCCLLCRLLQIYKKIIFLSKARLGMTR